MFIQAERPRNRFGISWRGLAGLALLALAIWGVNHEFYQPYRAMMDHAPRVTLPSMKLSFAIAVGLTMSVLMLHQDLFSRFALEERFDHWKTGLVFLVALLLSFGAYQTLNGMAAEHGYIAQRGAKSAKPPARPPAAPTDVWIAKEPATVSFAPDGAQVVDGTNRTRFVAWPSVREIILTTIPNPPGDSAPAVRFWGFRMIGGSEVMVPLAAIDETALIEEIRMRLPVGELVESPLAFAEKEFQRMRQAAITPVWTRR